MPSAALSITGCGKAAIACSIAFILPAESRPMALWGWLPPPPILRRCTLSRGRQSELSLGIEKAAGSASRKRAAKFCESDSAMLPSLRCRRGADDEPGAGFVICILQAAWRPQLPQVTKRPRFPPERQVLSSANHGQPFSRHQSDSLQVGGASICRMTPD